jgi:hypothetical protein
VVTDVYELRGAKPTNVTFDPHGELGGLVTEAERGEKVSISELGAGWAEILHYE